MSDYEVRAAVAGQGRDRTRALRLAALEVRDGRDDTALDGFALDVEVWRRRRPADGASRIEILLGCGGPSDGVNIDEYGRVTYWSTDTPGSERVEVELPDDLAEHWVTHFGWLAGTRMAVA